MLSKHSKTDSKNDTRTEDLKKIPCGMCRAMGLLSCRGHGGSGGGSGKKSQDAKKDTTSQPSNFESATHLITQALKENPNWNLAKDSDLTFMFNNPKALLTIELDMEHGSLVFKSREGLSSAEKKELNALFQAVGFGSTKSMGFSYTACRYCRVWSS
ncbi:MAG: hypothetical protein H0U73_02570 [Tatlockia sp.]|nr:hypothetical protein [Tatlockia sp.]